MAARLKIPESRQTRFDIERPRQQRSSFSGKKFLGRLLLVGALIYIGIWGYPEARRSVQMHMM